MSYTIVRNTRQSAQLLFTGTNTSITIPGNSSVSEIGLAAATDFDIEGVSIKQILYSTDSGAGANGWTIRRGNASGTIVWETDSTGWIDFAATGFDMSANSGENLSCALTGTRGSLLIELQKIYANTGMENYPGNAY